MFLAEKYIIRKCQREREEGFKEGQATLQAKWEAWLQRLEAAGAAGVEFTEPPPTLNRPARTNRNKQTASAF